MQLYKKKGLLEYFRQKFRAIDFANVVNSIEINKKLKLLNCNKSTLLEFGPGSTPLYTEKLEFFSDIRYIDEFYYDNSGAPIDKFIRLNLENGDLSYLKQIILNCDGRAVVFSDHCFEHINGERLINILQLFDSLNCIVVFRVPNILSRKGYSNYISDATHKNNFNHDYRNKLINMNYSIIPWIRFYHTEIFYKFLGHNIKYKDIASEILVYKYPNK